jgi:hypothetical protein
MIYQIYSKDLAKVVSQNGQILIISADSTQALVKDLVNTEEIQIIAEHQDTHHLLSNSFWIQPCTSC